MKRTFAIIGATGKVGSKVASYLLEKDQKVRVIARNQDRLNEFASKGAELCCGSATDTTFLTKALTGADAVFSIITVDMNSQNVVEDQNQLGQSTIEAIKASGIKNVVFISSVGGHDSENTGLVAGLARQEIRLNQLPNVNVLILRPGFFAENLLNNSEMIRNMNINGSHIRKDVKFPIVATRDIAQIAGEALHNLGFTGHVTRAILGARDYSMGEITDIIGQSLGMNNLNYVEFSYDDSKKAMMQMGMSESYVQGMLQLQDAVNKGILSQEKRTSNNSSPTTLEQFIREVFVPAYNSKQESTVH